MNVLNNKRILGIFLFLIGFYGNAQEIIKEKEPEKKPVVQQKRQKVKNMKKAKTKIIFFQEVRGFIK